MSTQSVCSICGANYEYRNGRWKCPACGAYKAEELSNEEATLLYSAAQKLRLSNFPEAEEEFSDIVDKYPQNANAYWGRLLAKCGIKYEEDFDGRKIPTCYAASIESVINDNDYFKAIELADEETRQYFVEQAEYIERVCQEWINRASKEKPYDVFICYKDSDLEKGIERTQDSIDAHEIYAHLLEQGYRVFFSRESLRNKVGEKYEPYIFNAISTAKVMLVYGSSAEYIKSTWLKNEWHRFYKKVVAGEKHHDALLVACNGFNPSELPTILSSRQCFDAERKTFFIDLDKSIRKIIQEAPNFETSAPKQKISAFSGIHEHTYKTKVVQATCIAKGYTIHRCDCGYEYRDSYTPLVDHKFKAYNRVAPTCTESGTEEKVCKICGEKIVNHLPALNHNFSKWFETSHATCMEDGESQRQCSRCGYTETRVEPRTEHCFEGVINNQDGSFTSYCKHCGIGKNEANSNSAVVTKRAKKTIMQHLVEATSIILCALMGFLLFYSIFGLSQLDIHLQDNISEWGEYGQRETYNDMKQMTIKTLAHSLVQIVVSLVGIGYFWDKKRSILALNITAAVSCIIALSLLWVQIDSPPTWVNYSYYVDVAMVFSVISIVMTAFLLVFTITFSILSKKLGIRVDEYEPEVLDNDTTTFGRTVDNYFLYCKSFFNNETTKTQKAKHFVGWSVILSFITMFATIGFNTAEGTPGYTLTIIAGIWIFANIPLIIGVMLAGLAERGKYKQQGIPYPKTKHSRLVLKLVSNWLLILSSMWFSMTFIPEKSSKPIIMLLVICLMWSAITSFYAHCPKQYTKIKISANTIMKRKCVSIFGVVGTVICLIIMFAWIIAVTG